VRLHGMTRRLHKPTRMRIASYCVLSTALYCVLSTGASRVGAAPPAAPETANAAAHLGPAALVASCDGRTLFVALADAGQVAWVDAAAGKVSRRVGVPGRPTGVALWPDGSKLAVTCAAPKSTVLLLDAVTGRVLKRLAAGHSAIAPVVSPDGKRLYVCNRFDHDVSVIDPAAGKELARVHVAREPVAAAVSPDGKLLVVASHLPTGPANDFYVTAELTLVETGSLETGPIALSNGTGGLRGVAVSPDGRWALVTHVISNFELVTSQVDFGWMNTNRLSIVDLAERRFAGTLLLDDMFLGAANPWAVGVTGDGSRILVTHAGTHELSVVDAAMLRKKLAALDSHNRTTRDPGRSLRYDAVSTLTVGSLPNDSGTPPGLRQRVALSGQGPRAMAVIGNRAFVANYFADGIDVVNLGGAEAALVRTIPLGPPPRPDAHRRGEMLFHDATICYQHWQSCATCHPDGRADALNWDLMNDGVGNPKNTKSMVLSHLTPPSMAAGVRPNAEAAVRSGFEHILFTDVPEQDAAAVDEYLKSLRPVPSPRLVDGRLSPAARRGQGLFESERVGCAVCHPAPHYTDLRRHDVGTRGPYDHRSAFDTPTLVECWRTGPYLHDGRYTSLEELLVEGRHGERFGGAARLAPEQVRELVEFVLSL